MIATPRDSPAKAAGPTPEELAEMVRHLGRPHVLVVGDAMLDQYFSGDAERMSHEAPVPLLRAGRREERAGGAANVALVLARLGADVTLAGVVGPDRAGQRLRRLLRRAGLEDEAVAIDPGRPTTRKRRYVATAPGAPPRQVLRVDFESRAPIPSPVEARLLGMIEARLSSCEIVLVSDYDKGVCTHGLLRRVIDRARDLGRRVLVDPPRLGDYARYRGASCLTPNRIEAGLASGVEVDGPERAFEAGELLLRRAEAEALLVTLDEQGMALIGADGRRDHFPTRPREVRDATGAGDVVLGMLGLCLACGVDYGTAAALGNIAGGLEVERWGVAPLRREHLLRELAAGMATDAGLGRVE
jgi:D-beta-D-heptose 7-phosphate kinase/D-beta-D-heptose 1-phosphate adenosyltransferase